MADLLDSVFDRAAQAEAKQEREHDGGVHPQLLALLYAPDLAVAAGRAGVQVPLYELGQLGGEPRAVPVLVLLQESAQLRALGAVPAHQEQQTDVTADLLGEVGAVVADGGGIPAELYGDPARPDAFGEPQLEEAPFLLTQGGPDLFDQARCLVRRGRVVADFPLPGECAVAQLCHRALVCREELAVLAPVRVPPVPRHAVQPWAEQAGRRDGDVLLQVAEGVVEGLLHHVLGRGQVVPHGRGHPTDDRILVAAGNLLVDAAAGLGVRPWFCLQFVQQRVVDRIPVGLLPHRL